MNAERDWPALWREKLHQLNRLAAQLQLRTARSGAEHAHQVLPLLPGQLFFGDLLKVEHAGVEVDRRVEIVDHDRHTIDRGNLCVGWGEARSRERDHDACEQAKLPHARHLLHAAPPSRATKWSPTRNALAMMVKAGFTAELDGKKLPSTT